MTTFNTPRSTSPSERPTHAFGRVALVLVVAAGAVIIGAWLSLTPPGILGKADAIGYAICHRIAERSFFAHDHQQPLCARCTGIYLGVLAGLGFFAGRGRARAGRLPRLRVIGVLFALGALYAIDGLNSYLSIFEAYTPIYQPHNTLRLVTGTAFGLMLITIVWPVFNSTIWRAPQPVAPVTSVKELGGLLLAALGLSLPVLVDSAPLRLILGLASVGGVVLMFGVIGTVLFLVVTRRENDLSRWRDLLVPALAGLVFAISVIGAIDLGRYLLTGTWDGFMLPGSEVVGLEQ